ncbi:carboxymuconolactone decarboxylase family protein [Paraburkholderia rhizosphaerae]|uniref:AhpD family alkylhydroperoxidase n=1 Tax=Paraburkholderia rhizosphaerae TaxID=480658 RepID=A0A4R8LQS3_9BURK|nr:carboxymuconolactone decarboxylase family protein [Paraburkholderia rhizosphaerae]TDY48230.1 AhpD family alkylhydroperoxidase [Paraburkholderia rhizosphaerae]
MTQRINYIKASPEPYRAFGEVHSILQKCGLATDLINLVYLRVSQINGCAFCIDMHTRDLKKLGVSDEKLTFLQVWHDAGTLFDRREKAAIAWAEVVTRVAATHAPDDAYQAAAAEFDDKELADLTYAISLMNAFNRLGIAFRTTPAAAYAKA